MPVVDNCQCTLIQIQIQIQSQYCWLPLQIVVDHCVLYFYPQHVLFPWPFPGDAWLWVCWGDFSRESPSWIVAEWGLPISLQNMPPQSLTSLAQCVELLDPLMLWDENLRLYLWYTWKWERYVNYCGMIYGSLSKNGEISNYNKKICFRFFIQWNKNT